MGGTIETFDVRGLDGGLADFLDVHRMAESAEGVAVIDFKDFRLLALADAEKENAFGPGNGEDGRAALELILDVFPAVANRLQPPIGFLRHAIAFSQNISCSSC